MVSSRTWILGVTALTLLLVGACPTGGPGSVPRPLTVLTAFITYTDQEIVDIHQMFPGYWVSPNAKATRPLGHPDFSADDCQANPESWGCRALRIRALAASQGIPETRMCLALRTDVFRKFPDHEIDVIDGITFDPAWLQRMPGDEFDAAAAPYRGGLLYGKTIDIDWLEANEDACCHDGVPGTCSAADRCLMRYGRGDDVAQTFTTDTTIGDMRHEGYRDYMVGRLFAMVEDTAADCAIVSYKPGLWIHYDGPPSGLECAREGDLSWWGSTETFDPCARRARPMSANPYGPEEYELLLNDYFAKVHARMDSEGTSIPLLTMERPDHLGVRWGWMWRANADRPHMKGEMKTATPPFRPPVTSLSVWLTPPPPNGVAPHLDVALTADVRGSAVGPIDYHLWCDCLDATRDVAEAQTACGVEPGEYHVLAASSEEIVTIPEACDYTEIGTYYPKVLVERDGLSAEDRIAVNVD